MSAKRTVTAVFIALYACATLQFVRFYVTYTTFYLNLPAYLAGHERLPFQARILPALLIRLFIHSPLAHHALSHDKGAFTPERAPLFLLSLVAISVAGIYVQTLYNRSSESGSLSYLVYPLFLFAIMWTYSIHLEANFSYPYDMLAVAFFSAGLYYIYMRRFWFLLLVVLVGSFNRETTLFLIPLFVLDAVRNEAPGTGVSPLHRLFPLGKILWLRVGLLSTVWLVIHLALFHRYAGNDGSENYVRVFENVGRLKPRLWPALLNICGYMLPLVVIFRRNIEPARLRNYLWIFPLWFATMFYTGVIVETRVYGELCPYVAVAAVLIIENRSKEPASDAGSVASSGA